MSGFEPNTSQLQGLIVTAASTCCNLQIYDHSAQATAPMVQNFSRVFASKQEQAHTRNKRTNEHDWKETAISVETSINTWGWQFRPKHVVVLKILKVTSVENTEKCFKTLTSRTKDGEEKW
jgi:hypothetical protein